MKEHDRFAAAGLHVVKLHRVFIAGSVDEMVGKWHVIEDFLLTFGVARSWLYICELRHAGSDLLFVWEERFKDLLSPCGNFGVSDWL
jgi:hypothetical protein